MDELERQLRDLAAHRASQVPGFDASSLATAADDDDGRSPNWGALLAVAALIVALLVGGGYLLLGRDDSDSVRVVAAPSSTGAPTTTLPVTLPPTTTAPAIVPPTNPPPTTVPCPVNSNDTAGQSGNGTVTSVPPLAVLDAVTAHAAQCVDRVTFRFSSTVGDWTVGYQSGPLTLQPSDMPANVAGNVYLVIRFRNTNTAGSLPSDISVDSTGIRQIKRIEDFEGVVRWAIGLDEMQAFGVSTDIPGQVTIELSR